MDRWKAVKNRSGKSNERTIDIQSIMYWNKSAFYQQWLLTRQRHFSFFCSRRCAIFQSFVNDFPNCLLGVVDVRGRSNTWYGMGTRDTCRQQCHEDDANNEQLTFDSFSFGWGFASVITRLLTLKERKRWKMEGTQSSPMCVWAPFT